MEVTIHHIQRDLKLITVTKYFHAFRAYLLNNPKTWETGKTEREARKLLHQRIVTRAYLPKEIV